MERRICYFAQPYWAGRCTTAQRYAFASATDADQGAQMLIKGSADGVVVYRQAMDVEAEVFGDADIIAVHGQVPRGALAIDDDGREPWLDDVA